MARTKHIAGRGYGAVERMKLLARRDYDDGFVFGISLILDGVKATIARAARHRRRRKRKPAS